MKSFLQLSAFALSLLFSGCASNPYRQFYSATVYGPNSQPRFMPYSGKTEIFGSVDPARDADIMVRRGYLPLGAAAFEGGGSASENQLREHAKEVGADVVLNKVDFQGSQQSNIPWITYNPGTTSTTTSAGTVNANVYNNRGGAAYGNAIYSGTSTTTTPGTYSTQMIPVTINRYKWEASFWRRAHPPILGATCMALPDEVRQKLQRNTGVMVRVVVDDSPAFRANILPGDVITAMGEEDSLTESNYISACRRYADQKVTLEFIRGTETKRIEIKLNPVPANTPTAQVTASH